MQEEDESYSDKSDADFEAALEEAQNMSPPPTKKKSKTKKPKKKKKTKTTSSFPGSEGENDGYEVSLICACKIFRILSLYCSIKCIVVSSFSI